VKRLIAGILTGFVALSVFSQHNKKPLYSGGMLILQPGYTITSNEQATIHGMSTSIGGIIRLYFFDYVTAGIYGGSQTTSYQTSGSKNSYINVGYGGPFIGLTLQSGKFRYTASGFLGMGKIKNLHIQTQQDNLLNDSYLFVSSSLLYSPILSIDYALTKRLYITSQAICLSGKFEEKPFYNPTFQLGILFSR
jgi:hypothetical protein